LGWFSHLNFEIENEKKKKTVILISLDEVAVSICMDAFSQFMSEHGWMCIVNEMRGGLAGGGGRLVGSIP
jgi:hypothetical protein